MSIIGRMTKSRGDWDGIRPVTKVDESDKVYNRKKDKREFKKLLKKELDK